MGALRRGARAGAENKAAGFAWRWSRGEPGGRVELRGDQGKLVQRKRVRELFSGNHDSWAAAAGHLLEEIGRGQTTKGLATRLRDSRVWTSCWGN